MQQPSHENIRCQSLEKKYHNSIHILVLRKKIIVVKTFLDFSIIPLKTSYKFVHVSNWVLDYLPFAMSFKFGKLKDFLVIVPISDSLQRFSVSFQSVLWIGHYSTIFSLHTRGNLPLKSYDLFAPKSG